MQFSKKQNEAYHYMVEGVNVFITGPAGTGKSAVIKEFYENNKETKTIGLTSMTGVSSLVINGQTLHSYLGIRLGTGSIGNLLRMIRQKPCLKRKWKELEVLIIDEVSMLTPELFDKLETLSRLIRESDKPFGGIQLILTGDFCQLNPIGSDDKFCFHSETWNDCIQHVVYLTENFRQDNIKFLTCLQEIRLNNISEKTKVLLKSCERPVELKDNITPIKLFAVNYMVDSVNNNALTKLEKPYHKYERTVQFYDEKKRHLSEMYEKSLICNKMLYLAKNAQVMLLYNKNIGEGLVNGSLGIVTEFVDRFPMVQFNNGIKCLIEKYTWDIEENDTIIASYTQVPLKLAYACSIHKIQGQTLDCVEVDLKHLFAYGQAYVALSRVKSHKNLYIKNLNTDRFSVNPYSLEYYNKLNEMKK